ncbi:MAG: Usg family protein [Holosporales bacterium]
MADLQKQIANYHLTTAEILYFMPDYPLLLQSFVWQQYDEVPKFPVLKSFLDYWSHHIEGKLHSVRISYVDEFSTSPYRHCQGLYLLH